MTRDQRMTWWFVTATFLAAWWLAASGDAVAFSWWGAAAVLAGAFVVDGILLGEDLRREWCP